MQGDSPIETIALILDKEEKSPLAFAPWNDHNQQLQVSFALGHTNDSVLLKYYVQEDFLKYHKIMIHDLK